MITITRLSGEPGAVHVLLIEQQFDYWHRILD